MEKRPLYLEGATKTHKMPLTPINIKIYSALLNQTGTNAPILTILHNTIGNIIWTYSATGVYIGTLTGAFTNNQTMVFVTDQNTAKKVKGGQTSINTIEITQTQLQNPWDPVDEIYNASIEIRVYLEPQHE